MFNSEVVKNLGLYGVYCLIILILFILIYMVFKTITYIKITGLEVHFDGTKTDKYGNIIDSKEYIIYNDKKYTIGHGEEDLKVYVILNQPYVIIDNKRVKIKY